MLKTWHGCGIVLEMFANTMLSNTGIAVDENVVVRRDKQAPM
jgi:hypothetical protein